MISILYQSVRIRLLPTQEQEILFRKSCGVARWAYNFYLSENERIYQEWKEGKSIKKSIGEKEVRKYINNVLKPTTHTWLKEVGSNVMKQAVKEASMNLNWYFKGITKKPRFKSKKTAKLSFYVNYESLKRTINGFQGEKIGVVKTATSLPKLRKNEKYLRPKIIFDGKYWYLHIVYELLPQKEVQLNDTVIGIDLGIKDLAVCSNDMKFKNINKTSKVKKIEKELKRELRALSRKMNNNILKYDTNRKPIFKRPLEECVNYQKQKRKIQILYKKLYNIRQNYLHQTTTKIVNTYPRRIVIEDLNIHGMMKNKHLAKAIMNSKFYEFRKQITYKCERRGIELVVADKLFPSSKKCSCCGNLKKDLKLSDRIYKCNYCGLVIDRDYNASLNLAKYKKIYK